MEYCGTFWGYQWGPRQAGEESGNSSDAVAAASNYLSTGSSWARRGFAGAEGKVQIACTFWQFP